MATTGLKILKLQHCKRRYKNNVEAYNHLGLESVDDAPLVPGLTKTEALIIDVKHIHVLFCLVAKHMNHKPHMKLRSPNEGHWLNFGAQNQTQSESLFKQLCLVLHQWPSFGEYTLVLFELKNNYWFHPPAQKEQKRTHQPFFIVVPSILTATHPACPKPSKNSCSERKSMWHWINLLFKKRLSPIP